LWWGIPMPPCTIFKSKGVEGLKDSMEDFVRFVNGNNLMDLELRIIKYTWNNGKCGASHI